MNFIELSGGVILNLAAVASAQWEPEADDAGKGPSPLMTIHLVGAGPGGSAVTRAFRGDDATRAYKALQGMCSPRA